MNSRRRGITLIEIMVAMALAGFVTSFVAGWLIYVSRSTGKEERATSRDERRAMLRSRLFQDAHRCRTARLEQESWILVRLRFEGEPDTVVWRVNSGRLERNNVDVLPVQDRVVAVAWQPIFPSLLPGEDPWWKRDRDLDRGLSGEELDSLSSLEIHLEVESSQGPDRPPQIDTLVWRVPCSAPG